MKLAVKVFGAYSAFNTHLLFAVLSAWRLVADTSLRAQNTLKRGFCIFIHEKQLRCLKTNIIPLFKFAV